MGLKAEVETSSNKDMTGICGTVVDETRNILVIEDEGGKEKKIAKANNVFVFELGGGEGEGGSVRVRVKGEMIVSRPEDRIKK
jgi:ribonuclease P protein subunit POP4